MGTFSVGDRVRNIRPDRYGKPNSLPPATAIDVTPVGTVWIKYDDDPDNDGWPEFPETLEKINA